MPAHRQPAANVREGSEGEDPSRRPHGSPEGDTNHTSGGTAEHEDVGRVAGRVPGGPTSPAGGSAGSVQNGLSTPRLSGGSRRPQRAHPCAASPAANPA